MSNEEKNACGKIFMKDMHKELLETGDAYGCAYKIYIGLKKYKYDAYLVGGCIRDYLLKNIPKDFDVSTNAPSEIVEDIIKEISINDIKTENAILLNNIEKEYKSGNIKDIIDEIKKITNDLIHKLSSICFHKETGKNFAVHRLKCKNNHDVEVASFRKDIYNNDTLTEIISENVSMFDDSNRRDLTMNALYFDPDTDTIIDCQNGVDDIKNEILRAVGDPKIRYTEDPLRILRALRFHSTLGFKIENNTYEIIKLFAPTFSKLKDSNVLDKNKKPIQVDYIPGSRIYPELVKLLGGKNVISATKTLIDSKIIDNLTNINFDIKQISDIHIFGKDEISLWFSFFAWLYENNKKINYIALCNRLKLPNNIAEVVKYTIDKINDFYNKKTFQAADILYMSVEKAYSSLLFKYLSKNKLISQDIEHKVNIVLNKLNGANDEEKKINWLIDYSYLNKNNLIKEKHNDEKHDDEKQDMTQILKSNLYMFIKQCKLVQLELLSSHDNVSAIDIISEINKKTFIIDKQGTLAQYKLQINNTQNGGYYKKYLKYKQKYLYVYNKTRNTNIGF